MVRVVVVVMFRSNKVTSGLLPEEIKNRGKG